MSTRHNNQHRLLIIESDDLSRETISDFFSEIGLAHKAASGAEGIKLFKKSLHTGEKYNFIIIDSEISGKMTTMALINRIRIFDSEIKVILTGKRGSFLFSNFRNYGFTDILEKPFSSEKLKSKLVS